MDVSDRLGRRPRRRAPAPPDEAPRAAAGAPPSPRLRAARQPAAGPGHSIPALIFKWRNGHRRRRRSLLLIFWVVKAHHRRRSRREPPSRRTAGRGRATPRDTTITLVALDTVRVTRRPPMPTIRRRRALPRRTLDRGQTAFRAVARIVPCAAGRPHVLQAVPTRSAGAGRSRSISAASAPAEQLAVRRRSSAALHGGAFSAAPPARPGFRAARSPGAGCRLPQVRRARIAARCAPAVPKPSRSPRVGCTSTADRVASDRGPSGAPFQSAAHLVAAARCCRGTSIAAASARPPNGRVWRRRSSSHDRAAPPTGGRSAVSGAGARTLPRRSAILRRDFLLHPRRVRSAIAASYVVRRRAAVAALAELCAARTRRSGSPSTITNAKTSGRNCDRDPASAEASYFLPSGCAMLERIAVSACMFSIR